MTRTLLPAVEVDSVSKSFRLYRERNQSLKATVLRGRRSRYEEFVALNDVSFSVPTGSTIGITGSNGSGKSTLLKCIARILVPSTGLIRTRGTVASLLELGSGFHPELTGRENVFLNGSVLRIPRAELAEKFDTIVDFAGIRDFIDQPVKTYSSGMYMRLAFSVSAHVEPDVLLIDEVIAVGDSEFQAKCLEKFKELRKMGRTVMIASHSLGMLESLCDSVIQLDHGHVTDAGASRFVDATSSEPVPTKHPVLVSVDILDKFGSSVSQVVTDQSVTFRLHHDTDLVIERPVFALELQTAQGVRVWAQHSRDEPHMPPLLRGRGSVDVTIARVPLQAGSYRLRAAVLDDTLKVSYDLRDFGSRLEVINDSLTERNGLTVLHGRWGNSVQLSARSAAAGGETP